MAQYQYYLEDFVPDSGVELGSKTITEEEIIQFAREYDPQPFHIDPEAAARSPFGGIIASGWQTCGIAMRLLVETVLSKSASIGSPGIEQLRWVLPVRPGDTLSARVVVLANRPSQTKPDRGTIKFRMEVTNQHGEQVMWHESFGMFLRRPK